MDLKNKPPLQLQIEEALKSKPPLQLQIEEALKNKPPLQLQIEAILKNNPFIEGDTYGRIAALFPESTALEDEYTIDRPYLERLFKSLGATKGEEDPFRLWPIVWLTNELYLDTTDLSIRHCIMSKKPLVTIITRSQLEWLIAGLGMGFGRCFAGFERAGGEVVEAPEKAETTEGKPQHHKMEQPVLRHVRSTENPAMMRKTELEQEVHQLRDMVDELMPATSRVAVSMETGSCTDEPHPVWEKPAAENCSVPTEIVTLRLSDPEPSTIRFVFNEENGSLREIARIGADGLFRVRVDPDDKTAAQFIECVNAICGISQPAVEFKGMTVIQ